MLPRASAALASATIALCACEPPQPVTPPHDAPWAPTELVIVPTKFMANKTGRVGFEIATNNWVYAEDRAVFHIDGRRILDPKGHVVAELGANGDVTFTGLKHVAKLWGPFDVEKDGAREHALPRLHFGDSDLVVDEGGRPGVYDMAQAPPPLRSLAAHFQPYDERGAAVDMILLALLMVPRAELDREPADVTGPMGK